MATAKQTSESKASTKAVTAGGGAQSDQQKIAAARKADADALAKEQEFRGKTPVEVMADALGDAHNRERQSADMPVVSHPDGQQVALVNDPAISETTLARADVGWHRPYAEPLPQIPDVSSWKSYQWGAASAQANFDRVILWPGTVVADTVQVFDAETCEEESVLFAGEVVKNPMVPVNYVDRRKRAMFYQRPDPGVPESLRFNVAAAK